MARTIINNPALPRSKAPHSNAVKVAGLIFVSGFPGYDEDVQVPKGDFATHQAADVLIAAERDRKQAKQLSSVWPKITFADAYAISSEVNQWRLAGWHKAGRLQGRSDVQGDAALVPDQ